MRKKYVKEGKLKPASPRLPDKKAVVYCTYGGAHTGVNEAIPAVKYMAQLFDHLGFMILDEWYFVGEYVPEKFKDFKVPLIIPHLSLPRKWESSNFHRLWIPAFAGMTFLEKP